MRYSQISNKRHLIEIEARLIVDYYMSNGYYIEQGSFQSSRIIRNISAA